MALKSGIDAICEAVLVYELVVVEVRAVCREKEDAREEELVVNAVTLERLSMRLKIWGVVLVRTLNFAAASGPCPRSTRIWRAFGWSSMALAMHRNASCETATSFPLKA